MTPLHELFKESFLSLRVGLHPTIGKIAHPSGQLELRRLFVRVHPKEDTLNTSRYQEMNLRHVSV